MFWINVNYFNLKTFDSNNLNRIKIAKVLKKCQNLNFLILAFTLSLPITWAWIFLIIGWVIEFFISLSVGLTRYFKYYLKPLVHKTLVMPILFFALVNFLSGCVNGGFKEGLFSLISLKAMIIYGYAIIVIQRYPNITVKAVQCLILGGTLSAFTAIIQQSFGLHFTKFKYLQATGLNTTPMNLAGEMQIYASLACMYWLKGGYLSFVKVIANKYTFTILVIINVFGLFCTCERSAIIGFILSLVLILAVLNRYVIKYLPLLLIFLAGAVYWFLPNLRLRLWALWHWQTDISILVRFKVWLIAFSDFLQSPVFGIGPRNFPHIYVPQIAVPYHESYLHHAHSNYLQVLATLGILGLISYFYFLFNIFYFGIKRYLANLTKPTIIAKHNYCLALSIILATTSLMISGLFEYNFGSGQVRLLQMFLYGFI